MNIPNVISLARLVAVPLLVYLIQISAYDAAFWVFVVAGASDAVDGFIARRMGQMSNLGSFLDPLADKALLVGVYLTLGYRGMVESLVVILVVFRDLMIVGGVLLLFVFRQPTRMNPVLVSKVNTATQILFAMLVLAEAAFALGFGALAPALSYAVMATTVVSGGWYLIAWGRQMASMEEPR